MVFSYDNLKTKWKKWHDKETLFIVLNCIAENELSKLQNVKQTRRLLGRRVMTVYKADISVCVISSNPLNNL